MFSCNCGSTFTRSDNLLRHQKNSCELVVNRVGESSKGAKRVAGDDGAPVTKKLHAAVTKQKNQHSVLSSAPCIRKCEACNIDIPANQMPAHVRTLLHKANSCVVHSDGVQLIKTAFKCRIASYRVSSDKRHIDYITFFDAVQHKVKKLLETVLDIHKSIKVNVEVFAMYTLQAQEIGEIKSFNTANKIVDASTDVNKTFAEFRDIIISQSTEFQEKDSGWTLEEVKFIEINLNKYSPLGGCSYMKLPKFIEAKKAVVNVKNEDEYCFAWAIVSALYPASQGSCDVSSYPHIDQVFNLEGLDFPMKLKDISKFENQTDISVNVYGLEQTFVDSKMKYDVVGPLRYSQRRLRFHVNLLLITDESGNSHYCWIKNLSRLVSSQVNSTAHRKYFCDGCLIYFTSESVLVRHQMRDCNHVYTTTPSTELKKDKRGRYVPENILKFKNFEKQMRVPFVVYADFESILKPVSTCQPKGDGDTECFTYQTHLHEPYSFAYIIKCSFDNSLSKFVLYRGENAAKEFVKRLQGDVLEIYHKYLKNEVPMNPLSIEQIEDFMRASACNICDEPFNTDDVKVRDHCHITGKKRPGAAHSNCNLNYKLPNFIPIFFHNMSGYDCHLFIKALFDEGDKARVIAQNKEKYISFSKELYTHSYIGKDGKLKKNYLKLRFLDSFRFLASSLDELSKNLPSEYFIETKKRFYDAEKFNVMRKKGVFPYSFMDSLDKINYPALPTKAEFYDKLHECDISNEEYERAVKVWELFKCKTLGCYSDLYLTSDTLILCDVFEYFRDISQRTYNLDPAQYYTSPGLSWDAMLRYTKVELELLTDIDMISFFKKGIRGGISQCVGRKHVANNLHLPEYNPFQPTSYIMYLDATNLYGFSMSQPLPTGGFSWLSQAEINRFDVESVGDDDGYGYVLEVDILYPYNLHDKHSDLPFLAENIVPPNSKSKIEKLVPNMNNKERYIIHYRNLKQALANGLILTRIHRILKFKQSRWLKQYIDLNTNLRNRAKDKSESGHYKRMVNSVYGKTMENVESRTDIHLKTHWRSVGKSPGASALMAKPNFKSCSIFDENFVGIHMGRTRICYNKPLYVGFSVLELSKVRMYDFYYQVLKKHFGNKLSLLYMDTDSFILKIKGENFYDFIRDHVEYFDTSNYNASNIFNIPITQPILGNFKDELANRVISTFLGTGAKAYYVKTGDDGDDSETKKAKGVKKYVIEKSLKFEDYETAVKEKGLLIYRKMNVFRSVLHDIYTQMQNKVALSYHDEKRFIIPNTTRTLPWGHKDIDSYLNGPRKSITEFRNSVSNIVNNVSEENRLDLLLKLLCEQMR